MPAPSPSAVLGIAVLVLIALGVIHLSSSGTAVPVDPVAQGEQISEAGTVDPGALSATDAPAAADGSQTDGNSPAAPEGGSSGEGATGGDGGEGAEEAGADGSGVVIVHVSGAVTAPGVFELPAGSRVDDAVEAAGGLTEAADLAAVNLARLLVDGEQIHIPEPGETPPVTAAGPGEGGGTGGGEATGGGSTSAGDGGQIDINTATAAQLEELPGVGPAIAQRIVEHRELNGPFTSVDDLQEVSGIGPATLEKMRDRATV